MTFIDEKCGNFFRKLVKDTMYQREVQGVYRPDMMQLLMMARKGLLQSTNDNDSEERPENNKSLENNRFSKRGMRFSYNNNIFSKLLTEFKEFLHVLGRYENRYLLISILIGYKNAPPQECFL